MREVLGRQGHRNEVETVILLTKDVNFVLVESEAKSIFVGPGAYTGFEFCHPAKQC